MKTIGLDLTVLQTPHRMRGIGATAINFVNNIPREETHDTRYVLFLYEEGQEEALSILDLKGVTYEIRTISKVSKSSLSLPGKLRLANGLLNHVNELWSLRFGDSRYSNIGGIDAFIQLDQLGPMPKSSSIRKLRVIYDVIPYVLAADYLWTYRIARQHGDSRKSSFRKSIHRKLYRTKNRLASRKSDVLIAISAHTKKDFTRYIGVPEKKIQVVHLGVDEVDTSKVRYPGFNAYVENSWGFLQEKIELADRKFLLYVGGADPRRRIKDLVAAYNNLRAEGVDILLVLVGDTMKGSSAIPIRETRKSIESSSYKDGVIFLGFVDETQKSWLYQNAVAFVYPSVYEGFGLPILEAMRCGAPVITYENSSIVELASSDIILYAHDSVGIRNHVANLLDGGAASRKKLVSAAMDSVGQFSWQETVKKILALT